MPNEERQPRDLRGLLYFCMTAGENPSVSNININQEEWRERREWLNQVFEHISVDVAGRMRELIRNLLEYVATPEEREGLEFSSDSENREKVAIEALEELTDWTEDLNFSIDFMKIGGFDLIPALLNPERALGSQVRAQTAVLLSVLVQNNPPCQDYLLAQMEHVFLQLLRMVDSEDSDIVRSKAVSAVSCSIRDHEGLQNCFIQNGGFPVLCRALRGEDVVKKRVSFLLASLLGETERFDEHVHGDIVACMLEILIEPHEIWHEFLLRCLLLITRRHLPSRTQCESAPGLQHALQERIEELASSPEHEESVAFSRSLCEALGWPCSDSDIPVLR